MAVETEEVGTEVAWMGAVATAAGVTATVEWVEASRAGATSAEAAKGEGAREVVVLVAGTKAVEMAAAERAAAAAGREGPEAVACTEQSRRQTGCSDPQGWPRLRDR